MKKTIVILFLIVCNTIYAQEIIFRKDSNEVISFLSSTSPLQLEPLFCSVNASVLIQKDTVTANMYILTFFYNTPKDFILDSTDEIEIRFSDGALYNYNYSRDTTYFIQKDSSVCFNTQVSYNCLSKMTQMPISEILFITPLYTHRIEIEDKMKLNMPNLVRVVLDRADEEFDSILQMQRGLKRPVIKKSSRH